MKSSTVVLNLALVLLCVAAQHSVPIESISEGMVRSGEAEQFAS